MKDKKSKGEIFVKKTITEWHEAKHEDACKEEIDYINFNAPKIGPFCGSKFAKKDIQRKVFTYLYVQIVMKD